MALHGFEGELRQLTIMELGHEDPTILLTNHRKLGPVELVTQASLGHDHGVDPKVAADQRGHTIGVAIDTYTTTDQQSRLEEVTKLENALKRSEGNAGAVPALRVWLLP